MRTHTRTHVYTEFANPYLICKTCRQQATGYHSQNKCGCESGNWNVPCEHEVGTVDTCYSWSPVDGCTCKEPHKS